MQTLLLSLLLSTSLSFCQEKPSIIVSIPAYKKIVEDLAGSCASVHCLIPPGVNFHSYEPRPRDIETVYSSVLWFSIMAPFEEKIASTLLSNNAPIQRIDLCTDLPLIAQDDFSNEKDPHIWLDPRLMKIQINTIANALKKAFPENDSAIDQRLAILQEKMDLLIKQVDALLRPMKGRTVVVAHGAYTYLCHEYGIIQLSLEQEGKEPTLASLTSLIEKAKLLHIKTVFSLPQHPKQGINRAAELLHARVIDLDPYTEEYTQNILQTAHFFREAMNDEFSD